MRDCMKDRLTDCELKDRVLKIDFVSVRKVASRKFAVIVLVISVCSHQNTF